MIKFRAWDKATSSYRKVLEIEFYPDGELKKVKVAGLQRKGTITPDKLVLEQFTGLKDAYDKDIYVGDILHFGSMWFIEDECEPKEEEHTGFVEYIPDYASYVVNCDDGVYTFKELTSFDGYSVQGNVHTNPELLEEDE